MRTPRTFEIVSTVLIAAAFAFPTHAETILWTHATTTQNNGTESFWLASKTRQGNAPYSLYVDEYASTTVNLPSRDNWTICQLETWIANESGTNYVDFGGSISAVISWPNGYATSTPITAEDIPTHTEKISGIIETPNRVRFIFSPCPEIPPGPVVFSIDSSLMTNNPTVANQSVTLIFASTPNGSEPAEVFNQNCHGPNDYYNPNECIDEVGQQSWVSTIYGEGTPYTSSSTIELIEAMIPVTSWGSSTSTGNGSSTTEIIGQINTKLLGNTTDRFPGCFVAPFLELVEALNGATNGTADPQSWNIDIPHLQSSEKSRLTFDFSSTTEIRPRAQTWATQMGNVLMAFLWLILSIFVLFDVKNGFGMKQKPEID